MSDGTIVHPRYVELTVNGRKATIKVDQIIGVFAGDEETKTKIDTIEAVFWVDEDYETVKRLMDPIYYLDAK